MNIMRWLILSLTLILSAGLAAKVSTHSASTTCATEPVSATELGDGE